MKRTFYIITVLFLALVMLVAYMPRAAFAYEEPVVENEEPTSTTEPTSTQAPASEVSSQEDDNTEPTSTAKTEELRIRVVIQNDTWKSGEGAPWTGTLVDKTLSITKEYNIEKIINEALKDISSAGIKCDADGITEIKGLSAGNDSEYKWTIKINDKEYNCKAGEFGNSSVSSGAFESGDVLHFEYTKIEVRSSEIAVQSNEDDYDWKDFRNSDDNMAVTDIATPVDPITTGLQWFTRLGDGSGGMFGSVSSPQIIVNGKVVAMSGSKIYMLDGDDGTIIRQSDMASGTGFSLIPPIYIEEKNMIVCALGSGTVQAFDSRTLTSLWVYKDPLGGQANTQVTYENGFVYTGFWISGNDTNFVCINIDNGNSQWVYKQPGGFYWTGAVVIGDSIIVGTDENNGEAYLYALDKSNGNTISTINLGSKGGQRSSIAYVRAAGKIYFTTSNGYLCSVNVNGETGAINTTTFKSKKIAGSVTATPIVYKDVVYIGSGEAFNEGQFIACDADSLDVLYAKPMKGFVKSSLLLSTAYDGYLYFYSSYNYPSGGITAIKVELDELDNPLRASEKTEVIELYDAKNFEQYSTASIICDSKGNLIYRNDTGFIQSVGKITTAIAERLINKIGNVTSESGMLINVARNAYNKLSESEKAAVSNYNSLVLAEKKYEQIKDGNVSNPASQESERKLGTSFTLKGKTKALSLKLSAKEIAELQNAQNQESLVPGESVQQGDMAKGLGQDIPWVWIYLGIGGIAALLLLVLLKKRNEIR